MKLKKSLLVEIKTVLNINNLEKKKLIMFKYIKI